jgi:chemotaxis protein CheC
METLGELLASIVRGNNEPRYALVVYTAFQVRDSSVRGFLVMVLSVTSLDRLIQEVEAWEERQGQS